MLAEVTIALPDDEPVRKVKVLLTKPQPDIGKTVELWAESVIRG